MASAHKQRKAPAVALAIALVLMLVGGAGADQQAGAELITTGHTTFLDASTEFNKCVAGIAGALMQRVTWFNGATLFSRMSDGGGNTYMYAMETLDDRDGGRDEDVGVRPFDPTEEKLWETGNEFTFADKNNNRTGLDHQWVVKEYYYLSNGAVRWEGEGEVPPNDPGDAGSVHVEPGGAQKKVYVYVVKVGPGIFDPEIAREYNFVMVVDTCKFLHSGEEVSHRPPGSGDDKTQPFNQHDPDEEGHDHGSYAVDVFVGGEPDAIPTPADPMPNDDGSKEDGTNAGDANETGGGS